MYICVLGLLASAATNPEGDDEIDPYANTFNKDVRTKAKLVQGYILDSDYPQQAIVANESGTTTAEFVVDPTGAISLCGILVSSGSVLLDARTCSLIQSRFVYKPARDKDHKAIAQRTLQRINWKLPINALPVEHRYTFSYTVGLDGKSKDCAVEGHFPPWYDEKTRADDCKNLRVFPGPPTDVNGKPTEKRFVWTYGMTIQDIPAQRAGSKVP